MSGDELRQRIALMLGAGELPRQVPLRRWGGLCRTGHNCQLCGETIQTGTAEIETQEADGIFRVFHAACGALLEQIRTAPDGLNPEGFQDPVLS